MQVLCGLQGIFLLFNCQTPEKNGQRHLSMYGVTQRKPLKALLPAFDTVLLVTCHGSSPQSYRVSRSVPLPDM